MQESGQWQIVSGLDVLLEYDYEENATKQQSLTGMHKRHMWAGDCCYNMLCSRKIRKHLRQTSTFDISQQKGLMEIILILPDFHGV